MSYEAMRRTCMPGGWVHALAPRCLSSSALCVSEFRHCSLRMPGRSIATPSPTAPFIEAGRLQRREDSLRTRAYSFQEAASHTPLRIFSLSISPPFTDGSMVASSWSASRRYRSYTRGCRRSCSKGCPRYRPRRQEDPKTSIQEFLSGVPAAPRSSCRID